MAGCRRDTDEVHLNATVLLAVGRSMAYAALDIQPLSSSDWSTSFGLAGGPAIRVLPIGRLQPMGNFARVSFVSRLSSRLRRAIVHAIPFQRL